MNYLTPEELVAVLRVARSRSARDWPMILIAYRHGMRASEVCSLRLADVDMRSEAVTVRRLKGSMLTVQTLYRHKGQPLLDEVTALRTGSVSAMQTAQIISSYPRKAVGFTVRNSSASSVRAEEAGLPPEKCHPHALKHSLASHLVAGNVNLALVRQCLGHKAISSTMKYVGVSDFPGEPSGSGSADEPLLN